MLNDKSVDWEDILVMQDREAKGLQDLYETCNLKNFRELKMESVRWISESRVQSSVDVIQRYFSWSSTASLCPI